MKRPLVLLLCLGVWGAAAEVDHAEKRGEHPDQEDIDSGQCVPMPCAFGQPTPECKRLCDLRGYETICQPPADFCLCRHKVHGQWTLVSPDEVLDQPPDSEEITNRNKKSKKPPAESVETPSAEGSLSAEGKEANTEANTEAKTEANAEADSEDGLVSFQIFAVLLPIKEYLYETWNEEDPKPTADTRNLGYEPVNVHEGRLFWDFRYILTGLLLLMIALVVYELMVCAWQVYRAKEDVADCESPPVVKVIPVPPVPVICLEKQKVLQV